VLLYNAVEERKQILQVSIVQCALSPDSQAVQFLTNVPAITEDEINTSIDKDNIEIVLLLQQLLENRSYKHQLTEISEVEALSALNLSHQVCFFSALFLKTMTVSDPGPWIPRTHQDQGPEAPETPCTEAGQFLG
jgi:hypothetical protein